MDHPAHEQNAIRPEQKSRLYDLYFQSASDIFCYVDENFIVRQVSPAVEPVMGYKPEEIVDREFGTLEFFTKESLEKAKRNVEMLLAGEGDGKAEYDLVARDGHVVRLEITSAPLRVNGEQSGFVLVARALDEHARRLEEDLERLQRADELVRESEERLKIIFEYAPDAYYLNDLTGTFVDGNRMAEEVTGYKREELIGRNFTRLNLLSVSQLPQAIAGLARNAMGFATGPEEYTLRRKDGSTVQLEISTIPVKIKGKRLVLGIARDVSRRKESEQALRKARDELAEALDKLKATQEQVVQTERLRALGQMASGIAHDFNNALMPILGNADIILSDPAILDDKEEAIGMIRDIHLSARDAASTVKRLHEFYRPRHGEEMKLLNVNDTVLAAVDYCRPRWQEEMRAKGIFISVEPDLGDVPDIAAAGSQVREMLVNLVLNSVDAMDREGTITISTRKERDGVLLTVTDTGTGMTEDVRKRCMEPFFSTKEAHGTGIGLSMVYGIVDRHGGHIKIESVPGTGTSVRVWLPVGEKAAWTQEDLSADAGTAKKLRVLCIDDEIGTRQTVSRYLESLGHACLLASDGPSGLEIFKAERPDLVLVDRAMPGMNGEQVTAAIREINGNTPVIMLTGFGTLMEDSQERPGGVAAVLTKPVTRDQLIATFNRVL